jgi:hypothetical protein
VISCLCVGIYYTGQEYNMCAGVFAFVCWLSTFSCAINPPSFREGVLVALESCCVLFFLETPHQAMR